MKNLGLVVTIFMTALFAGSAFGQTTPRLKIYIAPSDPAATQVSGRVTSIAVDLSDPVTIYRVVNGSFTVISADAETGPVPVLAGQSVRLRLASTNNRGLLLQKSSIPISYQVPCDGPPSEPATGVATASLTVTGVISDRAFNWQTEPSWKGTCRMMIVELTDRRDYAVRVRFN